jgi:photosystem II stability/assembly factor-like uncharacterized protein
MFKKSLISGIFLFLLLLLAGNACSETEPIYAGWAVGGPSGGYGTILRSTDSGKTWIHQGVGQIAAISLSGVFAVDPYTAWVVGPQESGYGTIYNTTNGGDTWQRKGSSNIGSSDYVPNVEFLKVHAKGHDVWAVGTGTILHTSDDGATWTNHIPNEYINSALQGVFVVDHDTVWVTGSFNSTGLILKTTNAGLTWIRQGAGDVDVDATVHLLGISAADADTAWAVGGHYGVLKTTDGGTTWTRDPSFIYGINDINEVYAVSTSIVWIATDNTTYWTTDGGATWDNGINHGLGGSTAFMGISAVSAEKAWTSYCSFTGGYIANTTDGGTSWTKITQLDGEGLPCLLTISFATQPINKFKWSRFVPAFSGKTKNSVD